MEKQVNKIFIFSQARSGSTMLQRILSTHSKISSISEPWLLLPFIYANKRKSISEYSHGSAAKGINDLINKLPNGIDDYHFHLKKFFDSMYDKLSSDDSIYFLDKTPNYSKIIFEISSIYPDAKYLFLFRNPVQVFGSMLSMWGKPNFSMLKHAQFYTDLIDGPKLLTDGYQKLKEKSFKIQYENLIQNPHDYTKEICEYLNIDFEKEMLTNFHNNKLEGWNGDIYGLKNYSNKISQEPLGKWKQVFNTRYRRKILREYVNNLDKKTLDIMGYDKNNLLESIRLLKTDGKHNLLKDIFEYNKMKYAFRFNRLSFD